MRAYKQEGRIQRRKPESGKEERAPGSDPLPLSTRFATSRTCFKSLPPAAIKYHRKVQPVLEDCLPTSERSYYQRSLVCTQCNQFARGIAPASPVVCTSVQPVCERHRARSQQYFYACDPREGSCVAHPRRGKGITESCVCVCALPCYALFYHVTRCFTGLRDVLCDMSSSIVSLVK